MYYFSTDSYQSGTYKTPQQAHEVAKEVFKNVQELKQNEYGCYYCNYYDGRVLDIQDDEN